MKHFIDCEFDGLGGQLLSMALVSETGRSMYAVMNYIPMKLSAWVFDNVHMRMFDVPRERINHVGYGIAPEALSKMLEEYFASDLTPHVIADWPDDLKYLCEALITGPGTMIEIPYIKMSVRRVDAYPTTLPGAVQHNAWWDAMALRHLLMQPSLICGSVADELTAPRGTSL